MASTTEGHGAHDDDECSAVCAAIVDAAKSLESAWESNAQLKSRADGAVAVNNLNAEPLEAPGAFFRDQKERWAEWAAQRKSTLSKLLQHALYVVRNTSTGIPIATTPGTPTDSDAGGGLESSKNEEPQQTKLQPWGLEGSGSTLLPELGLLVHRWRHAPSARLFHHAWKQVSQALLEFRIDCIHTPFSTLFMIRGEYVSVTALPPVIGDGNSGVFHQQVSSQQISQAFGSGGVIESMSLDAVPAKLPPVVRHMAQQLREALLLPNATDECHHDDHDHGGSSEFTPGGGLPSLRLGFDGRFYITSLEWYTHARQRHGGPRNSSPQPLSRRRSMSASSAALLRDSSSGELPPFIIPRTELLLDCLRAKKLVDIGGSSTISSPASLLFAGESSRMVMQYIWDFAIPQLLQDMARDLAKLDAKSSTITVLVTRDDFLKKHCIRRGLRRGFLPWILDAVDRASTGGDGGLDAVIKETLLVLCRTELVARVAKEVIRERLSDMRQEELEASTRTTEPSNDRDESSMEKKRIGVVTDMLTHLAAGHDSFWADTLPAAVRKKYGRSVSTALVPSMISTEAAVDLCVKRTGVVFDKKGGEGKGAGGRFVAVAGTWAVGLRAPTACSLHKQSAVDELMQAHINDLALKRVQNSPALLEALTVRNCVAAMYLRRIRVVDNLIGDVSHQLGGANSILVARLQLIVSMGRDCNSSHREKASEHVRAAFKRDSCVSALAGAQLVMCEVSEERSGDELLYSFNFFVDNVLALSRRRHFLPLLRPVFASALVCVTDCWAPSEQGTMIMRLPEAVFPHDPQYSTILAVKLIQTVIAIPPEEDRSLVKAPVKSDVEVLEAARQVLLDFSSLPRGQEVVPLFVIAVLMLQVADAETPRANVTAIAAALPKIIEKLMTKTPQKIAEGAATNIPLSILYRAAEVLTPTVGEGNETAEDNELLSLLCTEIRALILKSNPKFASACLIQRVGRGLLVSSPGRQDMSNRHLEVLNKLNQEERKRKEAERRLYQEEADAKAAVAAAERKGREDTATSEKADRKALAQQQADDMVVAACAEAERQAAEQAAIATAERDVRADVAGEEETERKATAVAEEDSRRTREKQEADARDAKAAADAEEADRKAKEEADAEAKEEAERKAVAEHKAKEDADAKAKEEADAKAAAEEADAKAAAEEANRKTKEEADRKAAAKEADRKAKEEADRKVKEEADFKAKVEEGDEEEAEKGRDRDYLTKVRMVAILQELVLSAIKAKPCDPILFMHTWAKERCEPTGATPAAPSSPPQHHQQDEATAMSPS